jgi:dihydrofolate synthase/folylpolyglutamate synthase
LSVPLFKQGKEFTYTVEAKAWSWQSASRQYTGLAFSQLALQNIATALMAIDLLQPRLPVAEAAIAQAIKTVQLPGRIERISQPRKYILDVAHNPAAVAFLAQQIEKIPRAVFSMLNDKDLRGSIRQIKDKLSAWYVAPLRAKRAASEEKLRAAFDAEAISAVKFYASITDAYHAALRDSAVDEEILVFGSFYTVGEVRRLILS